MGNTLIELKNIKKSYKDGDAYREILKDINLSVDAGQLVAIVGPSGSGKSTLLTIAGLLLGADSGNVIIDGNDMTKRKQSEWTKLRKNHIGFIFQNHQLLPFLTAEEQLSSFQKKECKALMPVDELLLNLGLDKVKKQYPAKMSGGEKQRVAIARAFVNNPDVILADEPTASLDKERGRQVVEMIRAEVKKHNKAAIMVTHDERVLDLADAVYLLEDGVLVKQ
ncbi:MAG: ABC transporter ATP-binding protein [Lachnospiraceae bacterium]|nr:ABC transporter ATP-binding protein [Lachnospiraceae bacterium]